MKRFSSILLILGFLLTTQVNAQYANEWIDFSKTYYRFESDQTGIHKIPHSALVGTGLNLNAGQLKLMYKGEQIPIYITTSGTMGSGDYIEFFGEENDGEFDTQLYQNPTYQLQDETSLFSETSTYFLVSDSQGPYLRYQDETTSLAGAPPAEDYFMYNSNVITDNSFHFGEPFFTAGTFSFYSTFDQGEGWCSGIVKEVINPSTGNNVGQDFKVPTPGLYAAAPEQATVNSTVVGRTKSTAVIWDQDMTIGVNGTTYIDTVFQKFDIRRDEFTMPLSEIQTVPDFTGVPQTRINFKAWNGFGPGGFPYETKYSVAELTINYPRNFDMGGDEEFAFDLELNQAKMIEFTNFTGGSNPILYDLTTNKRIIPVVSGGVYQFHLIPSGQAVHSYYLSSTDAGVVDEITTITTRNFTNYALAANQGNYMIVTNEVLRQGATDHVQAFADYRGSVDGGGHLPIIANIDELYDQFAWGIQKHPLSIRHFCDYALDTWTIAPKHLFIVGRGVRYDKVRNNQSNFDASLVPPFGYTPSDLMFVTDNPTSPSYSDDIQSYYPRMAVGRLPVNEGSEVGVYLDKVLTYESWFDLTDCDEIEQRMCMRDVLHIAKGWGNSETTDFLNNINAYEAIYDEENLGFNVVDTLIDLVGAIPNGQTNNYEDNTAVVTEHINNGLAFINYVGHSAPVENYWQFDLQHPSQYDNTEKYPFILSNSCFVGKINEPPSGVDYSVDKDIMAQDWVLYEDGGAIAFLAAVALSSPSFLHIFSSQFLNNVNEHHYGESLGCNVMYTIQDIYDPNDDGIRIVSNEFTYTGDPAIEMYHFDNPEYLVNPSDVIISAGGSVITAGGAIDPNAVSNIDVSVTVQNFGRVVDDNIDITINQYGPGGALVNSVTQTFPSPHTAETFTLSLPVGVGLPGGLGSLEVLIDGEGANGWVEDCTDDNLFSMAIEVTDGCDVDFSLASNNLVNSYCSGDGDIALTFDTNFGETVGIGDGNLTIDGQSATAFNTSSLGVGNYNLVYSYFDSGVGCSASVSQTVNVYDEPVADFDLANITICTLQPVAVNFTGLSSTNATFDWDFGTDAVPTSSGDNSFAVEYVTAGTKIVSLTVTEDGGCSDVFFTELDVVGAPDAPVLLECLDPLSSNILVFNLSNVPSIIPYSVDGVPAAEPATFTPGLSTFFQVPDVNNYTLEIESSNLCGTITTAFTPADCGIACLPLDLNFGIAINSFCEGDSPIPTSFGVSGGAFAGPGIDETNGVFDPVLAGVGNHTLTYSYSENDCEYQEIVNVAVIEAPTASIDAPSGFCQGESTTLSAPPGLVNYSWTGPGGFTSSNQTISVSEEGVYNLSVSSGNDCTSETSTLLTAFAEPNINVGNNASLVCVEDASFGLVASPSGGTFSGNGVTGNNFDPASVGLGDYVITYSYTENGCDYSTTFPIEVNDDCVVVCGPLSLGLVATQTTFCPNDGNFTVDVATPGGTFGGTAGANANGMFNPSSLAPGNYDITYTYNDENECQYNESIQITVTDLPAVNIVGPTNICGDPITLVPTAGYTDFLWTSSNPTDEFTTYIITVDEPGIYTLTVFDDNLCENTTSITVTGESVDLGIDQNPTSFCLGSPTVQLTTNVTGGEWSGNVDGNGTFNPNTAGTFTATYNYTQNGCDFSDDITLTVAAELQVAITGDNTICGGGTTILSAPPGYNTYSWDNGEGTQSITVSESGTYAVTVTDDSGCSATTFSTVSIGDADATISGSPSICSGASTVLSGPSIANASYLWGPGGETSQTLNVSAAGTYTLQVTSNGCTEDDSFTVTVEESLDLGLANNPTSFCQGDTPVVLNVNVAGGDFGGGTTTGTFDPVTPGTYTVTYGDVECAQDESITIVVAPLPSAVIAADGTTICEGQAVTLSAQTPGVNYAWTDAAGNPVGNEQSISVSTVGTYNLTVTDDSGCSSSSSSTITTGDADATISGNPSICSGASTVLSGPSSAQEYLWSPGGETSQTLTVSTSGTYTLAVVENGCTAESSFTVTVEESLDLGLANNPTSFCQGDAPVELDVNVTGGTFSGSGVNSTGTFTPSVIGSGSTTITYTPSGIECAEPEIIDIVVAPTPSAAISATGTTICGGEPVMLNAQAAAGATYIWADASGTVGTDPSLSVTNAGTYTLSVNQGGCSDVSTIEIIDGGGISDLGLNINPSSFCSQGDPYQLTVAVPGGFFSGTGVNINGLFNPSQAGIGTSEVTYTYQDDNGCDPVTETLTVDVTDAPSAAITGEELSCEGESITLTAPPGSSYLWSSGEVTQSITVSTSGTYTLTVENNGCESSGSKVVNINQAPSINLAQNANAFCQNDEAYQLVVDSEGGFFSGTGVNVNGLFTPAQAGVGTGEIVYSQNINGCIYDDVLTIEVSAAVSAAISGGGLSCEGESVTLAATTTGYDTYIWTDESGNSIDATNAESVSVTESGTYFLSVEDGNCISNQSSVAVTINTPPSINIAQNSTEVCVSQGSYQLMVDATGGFFSGSGVNSSGTFTPSVIGTGATTITYTTTENGCQYADEITINVTAAPSASIQGAAVNCEGGATILSAGAATAGYQYAWTNDSGMLLGAGESIEVLESGTYILTVNNNGCENTQSFNAVIVQPPTINLAANQNTFCMSDAPYQLTTNTVGGTYQGSGVSVTGNFSPSVGAGTTPITYTYYEDGCPTPFTETIDITVLENPVAELESGQLFVCEGNSTVLTAPSGYTYSWTNAAGNEIGNTASITVTESGSVNLFVSNGSCDDTQTLTVSINEEPSVDWSANPSQFCQGTPSYILTNDLPGGTYTEIPGVLSNQGVFSPTAVGTYMIEYVINGACSDTSEYMVEVVPEPSVSITDGGPICGTGSTTLSGTAGFETYEWVNLQTGATGDGPTVTVSTGGTWQLTATNAADCQKVETYELDQIGPFDLGLTQNTTIICDSTDYTFTVNVPGGTFSGVNTTGVIAANSLVPGSGYSITYTYDEGGCSFNETIAFEVVACNVACPPVDMGLSTDAPSYCIDNDLVVLNVGADYEGEGGQLFGAGTSVGALGTLFFDPSVAGAGIIPITYFYETEDGCSYQDEISIEVIDAVAPFSIGGANVLCEGEQTTLSAPSGYTYQWNNGNQTQELVVAEAGTYSVIVANGNCVREESIEVTVSESPTASITGDLNICEGEQGVLEAPAGFTYVWSTQQTAQSIAVNTGGEYGVTVYNAANCSDEATVNVAVYEQPDLSIESPTNSICVGESVVLTAAVGNLENGTYTWTDELGVVISNDPAITVAPESNQTYNVSFMSDAGCDEQESIFISIATDALPIAAFSIPSAEACVGVPVELLNESINANGNNWTLTNQTTGEVITSDLVNPSFDLEEGVYDIALDIAGCGTTSDEVIQEAAIIVSGSAAFDAQADVPTVCQGQIITLTATNGLDYTWEGVGLDATDGSEVTATALEAGTQTYTVTGITAGGCSGTQTVTVDVIAEPLLEVQTSAEEYCEGDEIALTVSDGEGGFWSGPGITVDGVLIVQAGISSYDYTVTFGDCIYSTAISIEATGVAPDFDIDASTTVLCGGGEVVLTANNDGLEYEWSGEGLAATDGTEVTATVSSTQTYTAIAVNDAGCPTTKTITIEIVDGPDFAIETSSMAVCVGEEFTLTADGPAADYLWTTTEIEESGESVTLTLNETTTITATLDAGGDCTSNETIIIEVYPDFDVTVEDGQSVCAGDPIQLNASGADSYTWSNADLLDEAESATPIATLNETTTFVLTASGGENSCSKQVEYTVEVFPDLLEDAEITATGNVGCEGSEIELAIEGGISFQWLTAELVDSPGSSTTTATITETTVFEALVVDANTCTKTVSYTANVNDAPALSIGGDTLICSGDTVAVSVTDNADYNYNWIMNAELLSETMFSSTSAILFETTTFDVDVEYAPDCFETLEITIEVDDSQEECSSELKVPNTITPNGDNMNDTWNMSGLQQYPDHKIIIYNRWGQKLLEFQDYANEWKGDNPDNEELPEGTYYYVIELNADGTDLRTGTITILR